jgi:hypothetical protein
MLIVIWTHQAVKSFEYLQERSEHHGVIMRSLHDVCDMNAYSTGYVRLSVRMIQLENRWTDFDEI